MNPWYAKVIVLLASVVMVAIRAPHGQRSRKVPVAEDLKGAREFVILTIALLSFFVPFVWIASPAFDCAEYPLQPIPLVAGTLVLAWGLWLFHRSHADLGANWSITLELREGHRLVTAGVYRRVRHPMYLALMLYALGQALVLPNWIAGPSYLVAMLLLIAFRIGPEERMLQERFGADYEEYRRRSKRLIPGVW